MPETKVFLDVVGLPAPQGSKVMMPNRVMVDGTSKVGRANLAAWRQSVREAAQRWLAEHPQQPMDGPIGVALHFRFPPVASDPHRHYHAVKPDIDKLERAVLDALKQGGLLKDDACVCSVAKTKRYAGPDESIGCHITVESFKDREARLRAQSKAAARVAKKSPQPPDSEPLNLLR